MAGAPLPTYRPMLATLGELPVAGGWGYEFKWDGVRAIVGVDRGALTVTSRNDRDVAGSYPELRALADAYPRERMVLDAEIVALDAHGVPSFGLLQQRMHVVVPSAALLARVPVRLYVFDVLHNGRPLIDRAYATRREALEALGLDRVELVDVPPSWPAEPGQDVGRELLAAARERGLEGVVAKRLASRYEPGRRSPSWVKCPLNRTQEVIICGWKPGGGRRAGTLGSLLLGAYDRAGRLRFIGGVGTGFTDRALDEVLAELRPLERRASPFSEPVPRADAKDARWLAPDLVGEVEFRSWTPDHHLRHPSWRGLRPDRDPREVVLP